MLLGKTVLKQTAGAGCGEMSLSEGKVSSLCLVYLHGSRIVLDTHMTVKK